MRWPHFYAIIVWLVLNKSNNANKNEELFSRPKMMKLANNTII